MNRANTRFKPTIKALFMYSRWNKSSFFLHNPDLHNRENCDQSCVRPGFVEVMKQNLFQQIQAVVPFNTTESSDDYLILFNINNVLKYCFTEETEVWHNFEFDFY